MDNNSINATSFMLSTRALEEVDNEDILSILQNTIPSQELIRVLRFVKIDYNEYIPFNIRYFYYKNLINQICSLTVYKYEETSKELALVYLLSFVHFLDDKEYYEYVYNYYKNNKNNQLTYRDEEWYMFEEIKGRLLQFQNNSHEWDISLVKELVNSLKQGKENYFTLQEEFFGDLDNTW